MPVFRSCRRSETVGFAYSIVRSILLLHARTYCWLVTTLCQCQCAVTGYTLSRAVTASRHQDVIASSLCDRWYCMQHDQGHRSDVFFGVRTQPLFKSWVRIGIGPIHFLRWIVYNCVCIQHDIDKSQISFIELGLCKTLRTNSGLRARPPIKSCLHLFWPQLCNRNIWNFHFTSRLWSLDLPTFLHRSTPLNTIA